MTAGFADLLYQSLPGLYHDKDVDGELRRFLEIDVRPLRRPLIAAAGFAAAISLGEFGATTFLTRAGLETMPIAIARLLGRAGALPRAQGFAMATLLMVVTVAVVVLADVERGRRAAGRRNARGAG